MDLTILIIHTIRTQSCQVAPKTLQSVLLGSVDSLVQRGTSLHIQSLLRGPQRRSTSLYEFGMMSNEGKVPTFLFTYVYSRFIRSGHALDIFAASRRSVFHLREFR